MCCGAGIGARVVESALAPTYEPSQPACSGFMAAGRSRVTPGPETKDLVTCSMFVVAPFVPPSPIPASAVQAEGVHHAEGLPARDTHRPRSEQKPAWPSSGGDVTSPLEGAQESTVSALHSWVPSKNLQGCSGPRFTSPEERRLRTRSRAVRLPLLTVPFGDLEKVQGAVGGSCPPGSLWTVSSCVLPSATRGSSCGPFGLHYGRGFYWWFLDSLETGLLVLCPCIYWERGEAGVLSGGS